MTVAKQECLSQICESIYNLRECINTWHLIADNAHRLNEKYGLFFGILQKNNLDLAILYLCKLFDKDNRSSSILSLLDKREEDILNDPQRNFIKNVKTHRNKRVAHSEYCANAIQLLKNAKMRWQDFEELSDLVEKLSRQYSRDNNLQWLNQGCESSAMATVNVMAALLNADMLDLMILHRLRQQIKTADDNIKKQKEFVYDVFEIANNKNYTIEISRTNGYAQIDFGNKKLHEKHIRQLYSQALEEDENIAQLIEQVAAGRPCTHKPMKEIIAEIKKDYAV